MTTFMGLDDKTECLGFYSNGELHLNETPSTDLTRTWKYLPSIDRDDVEYAYLYTGKELEVVCPDHLKPKWDRSWKKMKAFLNSFREAKIDLNDNCLYDMVPEKFLLEFFDVKCRIVDHILDTYEKPKDYEYQLELHKLLDKIKRQPLLFSGKDLQSRISESNVRRFVDSLANWKSIEYKQFGTKTGRLSGTKRSFPILTMDKSLRCALKPRNGFFVEFDYNAAELRTFFALSGWEQPEDDIHEWNIKNAFDGKVTREQAKKEIFAWLYNPSDTRTFGQFYDRKAVLDKYWDGVHVVNPYGRKIESDHHHALSYLVQSTTSDLVLRKAIEIAKLVEDKKTNLAFTVHDSIVLDLPIEEKEVIKQVAQIFGDTKFGRFKVSVTAGKDYGNMETLNL